MDIGIPIEAEGVHGEFYPGIVCGIKSIDEYCVQLLDSSRNHQVVEIQLPPSSMRPVSDVPNFPFEPLQGQEVDVLIPCSETSPETESSPGTPVQRLSAWWPGRVKKVGGGFVIVELLFNPSPNAGSQEFDVIKVEDGHVNIPLPPTIEKTDIVEKHQLRPRSHQPNLTSGCFHTHSIDIPDELEAYCRDPVHYQLFARRCGLPVLVCMAPECLKPQMPVQGDVGETYDKKARLLVISTDVSTVNRAAVIDNTFIDMLRHKVQILQQNEELSRKLEASRITQFIEDVFVPESLIPHAIGFQGSNIRRASNLEDVMSIKLNRHNCTFRIIGKSEEAVQRAKALMDYTMQIVPIPRRYVGPIVGSGQRHIQHIVDCLGLSGLKICDMPESDEACEFVAFHLTGTSQAIRDAHMFLDFHVESLQDLDHLRGVEPPQAFACRKQMVNETEEAGSSGDGSGPRQARRKPGRSSQRNRHKPTQNTAQRETVNGCSEAVLDSRETHVHENGEMHSPPSSDSGFQQPTQDGGSKFQQGQRQRRPQYMQSNNNSGPNRPIRDRDPRVNNRAVSEEKDHRAPPHMVNGTCPNSRRHQDRRRGVRPPPPTIDGANPVPVVH